MSLLTHRHPFLNSMSDELDRDGRWRRWAVTDDRLASFDCLGEILAQWRSNDRSERCYLAVSALAALGSRRGGDDPVAALAVVVLLQDGIIARAHDLAHGSQHRRPADDLVDEMLMAVWEKVRSSAPNLGCRGPAFLLARAVSQVLRDAKRGEHAQIEMVALPAGDFDILGADACHRAHADKVDDSAADLAELLAWAREEGVLDEGDVSLIVELVTIQADTQRLQAERIVGQRHGVSDRAVRRRRSAVVRRLQKAAPRYLASVS